MDTVTSSTDNKGIQELAADLSVSICVTEGYVDCFEADIRDIKKQLNFFKDRCHEIHSMQDDTAREDILSFQSTVTCLRELLEEQTKLLDFNLKRILEAAD